MLPKVALLLPAGGAVGVALLLASQALAPPFQLSYAGTCLDAQGAFGPCDEASARWYQVGGVVRSAGASGCLDASGALAPCEWAHVGGWVVEDDALCTAAGQCLGRQGGGAGLTKKGWAAALRFVRPVPNRDWSAQDWAAWARQIDVHGLWMAATIGAGLFGALAIVRLFAQDLSAGYGPKGGPTQPAAAREAAVALPPPPPPPAAAREADPAGSTSPIKQLQQLADSFSPSAKRRQASLAPTAGGGGSQLVQHQPLTPGAQLCQFLAFPFGWMKIKAA